MSRAEKIAWRKAAARDIPVIAAMAADFYRHEHLEFILRRFTTAVRDLIKSKSRGAVWVIESGGVAIGYAIVCCGFSVEYGGVTGFVDEFYIAPSHRSRGIGTETLEFLKREAAARGWVALLLEVVRGNRRAGALYRRAGFADTGRTLFVQHRIFPMVGKMRSR